MHSRDKILSKGQRYQFAILFALVPNAIAVFILFDSGVGYGSQHALYALAYCFSLPGAMVLSLQLDSNSLAMGVAVLLPNVLVDAWIAYQLTALRNWGQRLGLLVAYVAISRVIAFCWILFLLPPVIVVDSFA